MKNAALCFLSALAGALFVIACGAGPRAASGGSSGGSAGTSPVATYQFDCSVGRWVTVPGLEVDSEAPPAMELWQTEPDGSVLNATLLTIDPDGTVRVMTASPKPDETVTAECLLAVY